MYFCSYLPDRVNPINPNLYKGNLPLIVKRNNTYVMRKIILTNIWIFLTSVLANITYSFVVYERDVSDKDSDYGRFGEKLKLKTPIFYYISIFLLGLEHSLDIFTFYNFDKGYRSASKQHFNIVKPHFNNYDSRRKYSIK